MRNMELMRAVQTYSILTMWQRPGIADPGFADLDFRGNGSDARRIGAREQQPRQGCGHADSGQPKAIAVASGILFVMALIPGLPKILLHHGYPDRRDGIWIAESHPYERRENGGRGRGPGGPEPDLTITIPLVLELSNDLTPL